MVGKHSTPKLLISWQESTREQEEETAVPQLLSGGWSQLPKDMQRECLLPILPLSVRTELGTKPLRHRNLGEH